MYSRESRETGIPAHPWVKQTELQGALVKYDQHLHVVTESKMDSEPKYKRGSKQESESPITILIQKNQTAFVTFENNHFKYDFSAADTQFAF